MIAIYTDSQIQDIEWIPRLKFIQPYKIFHSESEYIATHADYKIAITSHRLHCDWLDENQVAYEGFEEKIIRLSDASNLVFSLESELHQYHWNIWKQCHRHNTYWLNPGLVNDRPDMQSHIIYWGDWFKTTTEIYKKLPWVMNAYRPWDVKPKYFDALLGSPKPHRSFIANSVKKYGLEDKFILTYGGRWNDNEFYAKNYFIWEPNVQETENVIGTMDYVSYHDYKCHLSQIIPTEVFNTTAYSIIAETDNDNTLSFYSEKTVKPMIYKRLFVAFTGYKFLENLRSLGFKTFDGIIDESYDQIFNDTQRFTEAFKQVQWLCNQNQAEIIEQARPILEHNYNLMMNTDWTTFASDQMQKIIDAHLNVE